MKPSEVRSLAARHSHFSLSHFCHDRLLVGALLFQFNHPDYASIFLCHSSLAALNFATLLLSSHLQCPKSWAQPPSRSQHVSSLFYTFLHLHISRCKRARFSVASSWMSRACRRPRCPSVSQIMSILICTYPVRLMPAWHSNFTAQSQVYAVYAGTSRPRLLYQMKKEKYSSELLNRYMTDRPADETEGDGNREGRKNKNWCGEVDWCRR